MALLKVSCLRAFLKTSTSTFPNALDEFHTSASCCGVSAAFIDSRTHFVKAKYEREADRFAIDLIMPDERFSELMYMPVHDIAESLGISDELANYRLDQIQMKFRDK